ncbi:alpha/beta hydrolase [Streptomyces bomunensis]|uniref:Alpha/beta hydrolase n=1 Tax=Streptomyces montanisoli TaxID=2798581 RepID=A0A940MBJ5_9ACTN|nr:alpha/beta hydrolase [Streptomyces montanisoli]
MPNSTTATSRRVTFPGSQGAPLAGRLDLPGTPPLALALFAHCFTCGKDTLAAPRIARALTRHGIGVLRFDFTGLGESGGDFAGSDFTSNVDDLTAAAGYLAGEFRSPALLVGHSLGGAAVLAAAPRIPGVRAVATIGAPADPDHVKGLLGDGVRAFEECGDCDTAEVSIAGRPFRIGRRFLDDIAAQPQARRIASLRVPLLVLHSPTDDTVGIDNARRIFDTARHPKSFVALDGADHLLTRPSDARYAADLIASWALHHVVRGRA